MHVNIIVQLNKLSGVKKYKISIFNLDIGEFELSDPTISSFSSTYGLGAVCHILIYPPPLIPSTNSTTNNNKPNLPPPSIFVENGFLCCSITSLYSTNHKLKHFCGKPWKKLRENQDYIPTGWIHDYRLVSSGSWIIYFSTQGRFKNIIMVLFKLNHVELGFEQLGIMGKKNWWSEKKRGKKEEVMGITIFLLVLCVWRFVVASGLWMKKNGEEDEQKCVQDLGFGEGRRRKG